MGQIAAAQPHLGANRTTILCHYLRIGSCGVGKIAPVIGLGRNNSAIAARHQPIQVSAHIAVAVTPGKMRRAICRNIDKMHVGDIIAKQIEVIVDGIPATAMAPISNTP